VPEVARGTVEIMGIAREPGYRSKVAVISRQNGVDPIGACVGVRGSRIQNIVNELGGERIDLIRWDPNPVAFVVNALSPAEVVSIRVDEATNTAFIAVPDKQLSLAIGKEGQNARLAARLTKRRIDIQAEGVLIRAGEDLYPPPTPNMEAIPLADRPGVPTLPQAPREVAPSQTVYARPGLPGERAAAAVAAPPAPPREEAPLPPEVEAIAAFQETPVAEPVAPAPPTPTPRRETDRGGLRFGDEIAVRRDLDDEEAPRGAGGRRGRRGGGGGGQGAPERARPGAQQRRGGRFEIDEEEIEEGLAELHGEQFDFGFEDDDEDDKG
jgi:N utilization substance protein A